MPLRLTVDARPVEVPEGATVLDAVNRLGIALPQLCKDPDRSPLGACRTCLVEVEGQRGFPASCHLPARDGMMVRTDTPGVTRLRRGVLDLTRSMLAAGDGRDGFGQLGEAAARHGLAAPTWAPLHRHAVDDSKSFFVLDREACILCGRCTTACDDVQQIGAISLRRAGGTPSGSGSSATASGVVDLHLLRPVLRHLPHRALFAPRRRRPGSSERVETTCPYCGVGCGIVNCASRDDGRLAVMADDVPANRLERGHALREGPLRDGLRPREATASSRPMVRRDGRWEPVSWDAALDAARRPGSRATADASGRSPRPRRPTRTATSFRSSARRHGHEQRRPLHAPVPLPSVEAMLHVDGLRRDPNSYVDYEKAGCLMIVGAEARRTIP